MSRVLQPASTPPAMGKQGPATGEGRFHRPARLLWPPLACSTSFPFNLGLTSLFSSASRTFFPLRKKSVWKRLDTTRDVFHPVQDRRTAPCLQSATQGIPRSSSRRCDRGRVFRREIRRLYFLPCAGSRFSQAEISALTLWVRCMFLPVRSA